MLQRLNFALDEEPLYGDGVWPRDRLLAMDASYTDLNRGYGFMKDCPAPQAAQKRAPRRARAFELGLESRAAAATVSFWNGSRRLAEEAAIGAAWDQLCKRKGEMAASEVLAFVRELVPGVPPERVRAEFKRRLFSWIGEAR